MFTDIAGFTSLMEKNEAEGMEVLACCSEAFLKQLESYSGSLVKVMGDVIYKSNDIFGDTVNVAARLEKLSPPGCICISREILNGCGEEYLPDVTPIGLHRLRGLGRLIEVYAIKGACSLSDIGLDEADEIRKPSDGVPSVAVIPFNNLGSEKDSFYAYGISADLADDLPDN